MEHTIWKLTHEEIAHLNEVGGNLNQAQEAKRQAFIKAGGVVLNPDALEEMYEALKDILARYNIPRDYKLDGLWDKAIKVLAKVGGN